MSESPPPSIPPIPVQPPAAPPGMPPGYDVPAGKKGAGKWVLFGCGGCLGLLVLLGLAGAGIFWFVMGEFKKSDVFTETVRRAQNAPEVQQALGTPVETGWMLQGSMSLNNGDGEADLTLPLKGPKGGGTARAKASKTASGPWRYAMLEVELPDGTSVDLRDEGDKPAGLSGEVELEPAQVENAAD